MMMGWALLQASVIGLLVYAAIKLHLYLDEKKNENDSNNHSQ